MKTIAIEEHFITPMYRQKVAANEFRNSFAATFCRYIGVMKCSSMAMVFMRRSLHDGGARRGKVAAPAAWRSVRPAGGCTARAP